MRTSKTFRVVMLPTEKASHIYLMVPDKLLGYVIGKAHPDDLEQFPNQSVTRNQHLYILLDDEIKEGDWCMLLDSFGTPMFGEPQQYLATKGQVLNDGLRKVVATTDKSLKIITGIVGSGTGIQLPQISESFIQAFIKAYNEGKPITEVDLEIEYSSYQLELIKSKALHTKDCIPGIKTRPDNTVIVHQSKMYTRDEVAKLCRVAYSHGLVDPLDIEEWIQNNL